SEESVFRARSFDQPRSRRKRKSIQKTDPASLPASRNALAAEHFAGLPLPVRGAAMPVLSKAFFVLRRGWQSAQVARRLKRPDTAVPTQQQTLDRLLEKIAATAYGRDFGITAGMSYAEFRTRVPVRDYDQ